MALLNNSGRHPQGACASDRAARMTMPRHACGVVILLAALTGCERLFPPPTQPGIGLPSTSPGAYYTAHEAYERIRPDMLSWHEDAFVSGGVWAVLEREYSQWSLQPDNRAPWWVFIVTSHEASSFTEFHLIGDTIAVGIDGVPGWEKPSSGNAVPLAIEDLIDTDQALGIAEENGAVGVPVYMSLNTYDRKARREIPLSWMILYRPPEGGIRDVYIDAFTGEIVGNEFSAE